MYKPLLISACLVFAVGCSSHKVKGENTADAIQSLEKKYSDRVGKAQKPELVEEFGRAQWCNESPGGAETCRFYKSLGRQWKGDKENRTSYDAYDEITADFDTQGYLRSFKAKAQR